MIGMLWLDADKKRSFEDKVQRAVEYYRDKYGRLPEMCLVNSAMLDKEKRVGNVKVQPVKTVQRDHFWLAIESTI